MTNLRGIVQNCTALAATLSAQYFSTEPFVPSARQSSSSLNDYLSNHGVLLTMCMDNFCELTNGLEWDHISASWITNQTGWSVIPDSQVGYILNPNRVSVQCVYPTDAMTLGRSQRGCGPLRQDPVDGQSGYQKSGRFARWSVKRSLERLLELNFGSRTVDTTHLSCDFVLSLRRLPPVPPSVWTRTSDGNGTIQALPSLLSVLVDQYSAFLGRPLCNVNLTLSSIRFRDHISLKYTTGSLIDKYRSYHQVDDDRYNPSNNDDWDDRYRPDDDNNLDRDDDPYADMDDRYVFVDDRIDDDGGGGDDIGASQQLMKLQSPLRSVSHRFLLSRDKRDRQGLIWWYVGPTSWKPNEWTEAMQIMLDSFLFDSTTQKKNTIWNEVVLATPVTLRSIVSAVFYTETTDADKTAVLRRQAFQQAQLLGGDDVPVLVIGTENDATPLFSCAAPNDDE